MLTCNNSHWVLKHSLIVDSSINDKQLYDDDWYKARHQLNNNCSNYSIHILLCNLVKSSDRPFAINPVQTRDLTTTYQPCLWYNWFFTRKKNIFTFTHIQIKLRKVWAISISIWKSKSYAECLWNKWILSISDLNEVSALSQHLITTYMY